MGSNLQRDNLTLRISPDINLKVSCDLRVRLIKKGPGKGREDISRSASYNWWIYCTHKINYSAGQFYQFSACKRPRTHKHCKRSYEFCIWLMIETDDALWQEERYESCSNSNTKEDSQQTYMSPSPITISNKQNIWFLTNKMMWIYIHFEKFFCARWSV